MTSQFINNLEQDYLANENHYLNQMSTADSQKALTEAKNMQFVYYDQLTKANYENLGSINIGSMVMSKPQDQVDKYKILTDEVDEYFAAYLSLYNYVIGNLNNLLVNGGDKTQDIKVILDDVNNKHKSVVKSMYDKYNVLTDAFLNNSESFVKKFEVNNKPDKFKSAISNFLTPDEVQSFWDSYSSYYNEIITALGSMLNIYTNSNLVKSYTGLPAASSILKHMARIQNMHHTNMATKDGSWCILSISTIILIIIIAIIAYLIMKKRV